MRVAIIGPKLYTLLDKIQMHLETSVSRAEKLIIKLPRYAFVLYKLAIKCCLPYLQVVFAMVQTSRTGA